MNIAISQQTVLPITTPDSWNCYQIRENPEDYNQSPIPYLGKQHNLQRDLKKLKDNKKFPRYSLSLDVDSEFVSTPNEKAEMLSVQLREQNANSTYILNISDSNVPELRDLEGRISPIATILNAKDGLKQPRKLKGELWLEVSLFYSFKDVVALFPNNEQIIELIQSHCSQNRRINIDGRGFIKLPYWINLSQLTDKKDRGWYQLVLSINDLAALLGKVSLKKACSIVGLDMTDKDKMDEYKENMKIPFLDNDLRKDFIEYSVGDCRAKDLEMQFKTKMIPTVYNLLDLEPPKTDKIPLTTGATVAQFLHKWILKQINLDEDKLEKFNKILPLLLPQYDEPTIDTLIGQASVNELLYTDQQGSSLISALVAGGRANNERPTVFRLINSPEKNHIIADADISGCYGRGLTFQKYPVGLPSFIEFSSTQEKITLGELLKKYKRQFIPGLWAVYVSGELTFDQDLIFSKEITTQKLTSKCRKALANGDPEIDVPFALYSRYIKNGLITHDILQALKFHASTKEWNEIRDLTVEVLMYYPKSLQCGDIDEFLEKHEKNTKGIRFKHINKGIYQGRNIKLDERCSYWFSLDLADLINPLLDARKRLKAIAKGRLEGEALIKESQELIDLLSLNCTGVIDKSTANSVQDCLKLFINTVYGTVASPFFTIGNTCVANNITARARTLSWMMKNGTNSFQSITDGSAYDLNEVRDWSSIPSLNKICQWQKNEIQKDDKQRFPLVPLGNDGEWKIVNYDGELTLQNNSQTIVGKSDNWGAVDTLYHAHLKRLYSINDECKIDVLNQMSFEHKDLYKGIITHSQTNYAMLTFDDKWKIKARGQKVDKSVFIDDTEQILEYQHPYYHFIQTLSDRGVAPVFSKFQCQELLKINQVKKMKESHAINEVILKGLTAGDAIYKNKDISIISLSQFLYQNPTQKKQWMKWNDKFKTELGWGIEAFFYDSEKLGIDYGKAINKIQKCINNGWGWLEDISLKDSKYLYKKVKQLKSRSEALAECGCVMNQIKSVKSTERPFRFRSQPKSVEHATVEQSPTQTEPIERPFRFRSQPKSVEPPTVEEATTQNEPIERPFRFRSQPKSVEHATVEQTPTQTEPIERPFRFRR